MRLQPVRRPDLLHRAVADADRPGEPTGAPLRGIRRRLVQRQLHHPLDHGLGQGWPARRPGRIAQQPVDALSREAL